MNYRSIDYLMSVNDGINPFKSIKTYVRDYRMNGGTTTTFNNTNGVLTIKPTSLNVINDSHLDQIVEYIEKNDALLKGEQVGIINEDEGEYYGTIRNIILTQEQKKIIEDEQKILKERLNDPKLKLNIPSDNFNIKQVEEETKIINFIKELIDNNKFDDIEKLHNFMDERKLKHIPITLSSVEKYYNKLNKVDDEIGPFFKIADDFEKYQNQLEEDLINEQIQTEYANQEVNEISKRMKEYEDIIPDWQTIQNGVKKGDYLDSKKFKNNVDFEFKMNEKQNILSMIETIDEDLYKKLKKADKGSVGINIINTAESGLKKDAYDIFDAHGLITYKEKGIQKQQALIIEYKYYTKYANLGNITKRSEVEKLRKERNKEINLFKKPDIVEDMIRVQTYNYVEMLRGNRNTFRDYRLDKTKELNRDEKILIDLNEEIKELDEEILLKGLQEDKDKKKIVKSEIKKRKLIIKAQMDFLNNKNEVLEDFKKKSILSTVNIKLTKFGTSEMIANMDKKDMGTPVEINYITNKAKNWRSYLDFYEIGHPNEGMIRNVLRKPTISNPYIKEDVKYNFLKTYEKSKYYVIVAEEDVVIGSNITKLISDKKFNPSNPTRTHKTAPSAYTKGESDHIGLNSWDFKPILNPNRKSKDLKK